jgi:hypothetical protein
MTLLIALVKIMYMHQMSVPGLLFADYLAIRSFIVNGLQKGIDQVIKLWNFKKTRLLIFKKREMLKKRYGFCMTKQQRQ